MIQNISEDLKTRIHVSQTYLEKYSDCGVANQIVIMQALAVLLQFGSPPPQSYEQKSTAKNQAGHGADRTDGCAVPANPKR